MILVKIDTLIEEIIRMDSHFQTRNMIISPHNTIRDSFKEQIRIFFNIAITSTVLSVALNQVIGMLQNIDQDRITDLHIKTIVQIFTISFLFVIMYNIIKKIKMERNGEPLTQNEIGILMTTVIGFSLYTFMEMYNKGISDVGSFVTPTAIALNLFINFILNTSYLNDIFKKIMSFNKKK